MNIRILILVGAQLLSAKVFTQDSNFHIFKDELGSGLIWRSYFNEPERLKYYSLGHRPRYRVKQKLLQLPDKIKDWTIHATKY